MRTLRAGKGKASNWPVAVIGLFRGMRKVGGNAAISDRRAPIARISTQLSTNLHPNLIPLMEAPTHAFSPNTTAPAGLIFAAFGFLRYHARGSPAKAISEHAITYAMSW
jgi:hypothetical protein